MTTETSPGILYVVATPIGNMEDVTARALRILREVRLIACEDTRRTSQLLHHFQIATPVLSYHKFNEKSRLDSLLHRLRDHQSIALVSDAGTPALSDPGSLLIRACRQEGFQVVAIPGASAVLTALASSSFGGDPFLFVGFLPSSRSHRRKCLTQLRTVPWNLVFYESPLRLKDCLLDILETLGNRVVFLGRELTKHFEETMECPLDELLPQLQPRDLKGEITLIVAGAGTEKTPEIDLSTAVEQAKNLISTEGISKKEAARRIAQISPFSARQIYQGFFH
jgi:16S rRNA (cytidine1402-2'-O)-methyltransferase